jgi:ubiquinone/menaquinone biosynthesis C-methylase UbiE
MTDLSPRLRRIVDALPLTPGLRVLEIGGGPGAAARAVADRLTGGGSILMIDRSATALELARRGSADQLAAGTLRLRQAAVEDFTLEPDEEPFDLAFAVRVGALDGRHPEAGALALRRLRAALKPSGRLFIDGGDPLRELALPPG